MDFNRISHFLQLLNEVPNLSRDVVMTISLCLGRFYACFDPAIETTRSYLIFLVGMGDFSIVTKLILIQMMRELTR